MNATADHGKLLTAASELGFRVFDMVAYRQMVEGCLDLTGRREKRRRALPASLMVDLVVGMGLFRNLAIAGVFDELTDWMREHRPDLPLKAVTDEAVGLGRRRLGVEPIAALFHGLADRVEPPATFHGLRTWTIDGVNFEVPDTKPNTKAFRKVRASKGSQTAFPQVQAVVLLASQSREVKDVILQNRYGSERNCCAEFLEHLGPDDLGLLDRGFHAVWLFKRFIDKGAHFLCRAQTTFKPRVLRELGPGEWLVEASARVPIPKKERRRGGPKTTMIQVVLRMIQTRIPGHKSVRLLTDLTDSVLYPALELGLFYHERWEAEIANDELKTHLAAVGGGTVRIPMRSKTPNGVIQEAYGLFVAYNLVRNLMTRAAQAANIPPQELGFTESLNVIRRSAPRFERATYATILFLVTQLLDDLARCRLKRSRRPRRCPRVIRIKIKHFPRKRRSHKEKPNIALTRMCLVRRLLAPAKAH